MIQIEALKCVVHTTGGTFGRTVELSKGLNIIRADNTSGKSSMFGAILYGLGFEEILGSRNEKALQSVFKSVVKEVIVDDEIEHQVVQSEIYLQITNGTEAITTKRFVKNDNIKPQAVEVFFGRIVTEVVDDVLRQPMYVHDSGAAKNEDVGFHKFLEKFIGAPLPEIINQDGRRVKMFLPLVAAAHFIEQKAGWSDLYANMPFYGIRDAAAKVFEYILAFDVFEIAAKRQEAENKLKIISDAWFNLKERIDTLASKGGGQIIGMAETPQIEDSTVKPYIKFLRGDKTFLLQELLATLNVELEQLQLELKTPVNDKIDEIESQLNKLRNDTERYEILYETLRSESSQERERVRMYVQQMQNVDEDLRKNKDVEKLQSIGFQAGLEISKGSCPTCHQEISDTLLSSELQVVPMRIDQNIAYLQAQKKMIHAFLTNLKEQVKEKDNRVAALEQAIYKNRQKIRALKRTLVSDDRLPSEELIERKVVLEREIKFLYKLREEFEQLLSEIYKVGKDYQLTKGAIAGLTQKYLTNKDQQKLSKFEDNFRLYLHKFGFTSKPIQTLRISAEKYLPVFDMLLPNGLSKQVDIRFESSGSDYIRTQWAYYTSLLKTSIEVSGNHFNFVMFDEPQQQSAGQENFEVFLEELQSFREQQVIVFASFQNSNDNFVNVTQGLFGVNIVDYVNERQMFIERID